MDTLVHEVKSVPFPPKGNVRPCFVFLTEHAKRELLRSLPKTGEAFEPHRRGLNGHFRAYCSDEDKFLKLCNMDGDVLFSAIPRHWVMRPYYTKTRVSW